MESLTVFLLNSLWSLLQKLYFMTYHVKFKQIEYYGVVFTQLLIVETQALLGTVEEKYRQQHSVQQYVTAVMLDFHWMVIK